MTFLDVTPVMTTAVRFSLEKLSDTEHVEEKSLLHDKSEIVMLILDIWLRALIYPSSAVGLDISRGISGSVRTLQREIFNLLKSPVRLRCSESKSLIMHRSLI